MKEKHFIIKYIKKGVYNSIDDFGTHYIKSDDVADELIFDTKEELKKTYNDLIKLYDYQFIKCHEKIDSHYCRIYI